MPGIIELIAGGSVGKALEGLGQFAKSIREAITGKSILDPNKQAEILLQAQEMEHAIVLAAAAYDKAQMEAQLAERLKAFPTRDDFFASMDRILGELKAIRDEQTSLSHLVVRHEDRLAVLEALHPDGQHV